MLRILCSLLVVVMAALAFVLSQPLLYLAAAALLIAVGILVLLTMRRRKQVGHNPLIVPAILSEEEELKALGIVDIRPKQMAPLPDDLSGKEPEDPSKWAPKAVLTTSRPQEPQPFPVASYADHRPHPGASPPRTVWDAPPRKTNGDSATAKDKQGRGEETPQDAYLLPYLRALQEALQAETVCLLKQKDITPVYQVEALVARRENVRPRKTFRAETTLLTAAMATEPVTVRHVGPGSLSAHSLGYRRDNGAIREIAMAPIPELSTVATYFLVVDTARKGHLQDQQTQTLIQEFAHLLGTLLTLPHLRSTLRPRREIVAEEMEKARTQNRTLALALVHLNQAEAIADEGTSAVATAEQALENELRKVLDKGRVERFGEMTYGVFYEGGIHEVETWSTQLQNDAATDESLLKGGVSIGVALLQQHHKTPDDFRADATEALRVAYESGTCTILA